MTRRRALLPIAAVATSVAALALASPPALALGPLDPLCLAGGGLAPGVCSSPGSAGGIVPTATSALTGVALGAFVSSVVGSAKYVLDATGQILSRTTAPQLSSTWFSATYWRVAAVAAVLTLPFLFAAAVQALIRSDLTLLLRAACGYLPLALLAVGIAAPLTMLLLAASDQMSAVVSSTAGNQGVGFLDHAAALLGTIAANFGSPFLLFLIGLLTVGGALALWVELLVRAAAVYVIVLMLPLAFAALVWPARRIWAIRSIELLIALIVSKFVIVAVLTLGGAALDQSANRSVTGLLAGGVLMALASLAPWALLRLIPLAEVASAAAGSLRSSGSPLRRLQQSDAWAAEGDRWISNMARMRDAAGKLAPSSDDEAGQPPTPDTAPAAAATSKQPPASASATGEQPPASASGAGAGAGAADPSPTGDPLPPTDLSWRGGTLTAEIENLTAPQTEQPAAPPARPVATPVPAPETES